MSKDVFFYDHYNPEKRMGAEDYENLHEAEMAIALAEHLIEFGIPPDNITIITPYPAQANLIGRLIVRITKERGGKVEKVLVREIDKYQIKKLFYVSYFFL